MLDRISIVGRGPRKVIVLHGWFGCADEWGNLFQVLDRTNFTYAFFDYRGYGKRKNEKAGFTLEEITEDTLAVADALGWQRFDLIGHSMGGMAIQHVAASSPSRVRSLVGITPVPARGFKLDQGTRELFEAAATESLARKTIIDFGTGQRLSTYWVDQVVASSFENSLPEAVMGYFCAWADSDIEPVVTGSQIPVLALFGEHDAALAANDQAPIWARLYPNFSSDILSGAGHYPFEETPVLLATKFEAWLAAQAS